MPLASAPRPAIKSDGIIGQRFSSLQTTGTMLPPLKGMSTDLHSEWVVPGGNAEFVANKGERKMRAKQELSRTGHIELFEIACKRLQRKGADIEDLFSEDGMKSPEEIVA
eukprot:3470837-Prymnesium_polylepis.1